MSYKKRGKAGWCNKREAKAKIYKERNHGKKEIKQALTEIERGDDYRYTYSSKSKNPEQKLEGRIKSILNSISRWSTYYDSTGWQKQHLNWLKSWLNETKDKLNKIREKKL